jgi:D-glycero-alpha-D-manno-heptose 1-phosphate guanylyltransferase
MEMIILAGGMGTRLRTVVSDVPKPMAPINGRPFLQYIFEWISNYEVDRAILSVGYKAPVISEYFGNKFKNIHLEYCVEEHPLGTGGAIKLSLRQTGGDNILVVNADTYFPIDISRFIDFHVSGNAMLSIALKKMEEFDRYGTVELSNGDCISTFKEKEYCEQGLINGGIYLINKAFINSLSLPEVFSFEKEVLEKCTNTGYLKGALFNDPFVDIGVPEDYYRASDIV